LEELPGNIQRVMGSLVEVLKSRESVISIGLFGSRSRGDASSTSDVDLLVVDARDLNYEYVERAEIEGVFLDLNYVPERWVQKEFPPEIDQKIYESKILHDPDGILKRAKETMMKIMWLPERVEIRTGSYLVKADTLMSRGISAYGREDYQSAKLNAVLGLETMLRIMLEIDKKPFSNSRYVRDLEASAKSLNLTDLYGEYLDVSGLSRINKKKAEEIFTAFSDMWNAATDFVEANTSVLQNLHDEIVNNLNFYCKRSFLHGITARARSLLQEGHAAEAVHYMLCSSVSMLENYTWLLAGIEGGRFDYTTLLKQLKNSKASPNVVYENAVEVLIVKEVSPEGAEATLEKAKSVILSLRKMRRELIAGMSPQ
jgi:predicted nucleotidyltransferase